MAAADELSAPGRTVWSRMSSTTWPDLLGELGSPVVSVRLL